MFDKPAIICSNIAGGCIIFVLKILIINIPFISFIQVLFLSFTNIDANLQLHVKDKKLFTPGPLGTSFDTKKVMMRDVGSRDEDFISCIQFIRRKLLEVAGTSPKEYTVIPIQGSGTYSIESVLTTATPRDSNAKLLIIVSGAYGKRMVKICEIAGIKTVSYRFPTEFADLQQKLLHHDVEVPKALGFVFFCDLWAELITNQPIT